MANTILICSTHHRPVSSLNERFVPDVREFEPWKGWKALADKIAYFITTFGHEEVENTILNPGPNGKRQVVWKATKLDSTYRKITFTKVIQDESIGFKNI